MTHGAMYWRVAEGCARPARSKHPRYGKRATWSVIHAHPPGATGFAVAHRSMDIQHDRGRGGHRQRAADTLRHAQHSEVPDAIEPYLEDTDVDAAGKSRRAGRGR